MWMILKGLLALLATTGALACGRASSPTAVSTPVSISRPQPVSMAQAPTCSDGLYPVSAPGDAATSGAAVTGAPAGTNPKAHWGRIHGGDHPVPDDKWVAPAARIFWPSGYVRIAVSHATGDCTSRAVRKQLVSRGANLRGCYETAMLPKPKLAGRLVLSLRQTNAAPDLEHSRIYHDVMTCSVLQDTVNDAPMTACVCRWIQRAKLPWRTRLGRPRQCSVEATLVFTSKPR